MISVETKARFFMVPGGKCIFPMLINKNRIHFCGLKNPAGDFLRNSLHTKNGFCRDETTVSARAEKKPMVFEGDQPATTERAGCLSDFAQDSRSELCAWLNSRRTHPASLTARKAENSIFSGVSSLQHLFLKGISRSSPERITDNHHVQQKSMVSSQQKPFLALRTSSRHDST